MIEKDCALGNVQLTVQTVCFTEFLTLRAVSRVSANIVLFSLQLTEVMRGLRTRPSAVPTQYGLSIRLMIKLHASLFRRQWRFMASLSSAGVRGVEHYLILIIFNASVAISSPVSESAWNLK